MLRTAYQLTDELESARGLTELDREVIRMLQTDGRLPYIAIARALETTEKQIRLRVEELRYRGVIHITTLTHPRLMGYNAIALLGIRVDPSFELSSLSAQLAAVPGAFYVAVVAGRYNVVVELYCPDMAAVRSTIDHHIGKIEGIAALDIYPYLRLHYRFPAFDAASTKVGKDALTWVPRSAPEELDNVDRAIIALLHSDGRMSFRDVGRQLEVSEKQVRRRVKRLNDIGAMRVIALTRPGGIGFESAAFIMVRVAKGESIHETAEALARLPGVIYVASCTGLFDVMAEIVCTDEQQLFDALDTSVRTLPGVARAEVWMQIELHYRRVAPLWETQFHGAMDDGR